MQKVYERINWEDEPSQNTPLGEDNLNKMDYALDVIDNRVVNLSGYEERASESATNASLSETNAQNSETVAVESATLAQSYAVGGTETRDNEDIDNAQYYYEQAKRVAEGLSGTLLPAGTITFAELATVTSLPGYMYNISDAFTTDDTFLHSGVLYGAGTNVYLTIDEKWDVLAGSNVISVNGKTGVVYISSTEIPSTRHVLDPNETYPPVGGAHTVESELERYAELIKLLQTNLKKGSYNNELLFGVTGYITSSGTEARLYIPMNIYPGYTSISITNITTSIRTSEGGYLGGAVTVDLTEYIENATLAPAQNIANIKLKNTDGWGLTNNTLLGGLIYLTYKIS